uniref:Reverse transcriptase zinc-binding domain-containing protein n=1 Tax=Setaria italica TaxID=4555 RepID=K4AIA8_SETIT
MLLFSSAGFYRWTAASQPADPFAAHIWANVAIPCCKQHFLWLVHRHRLPSAALLRHRNIIDSPSCTFCGAHEDQDHLLLRCNRARRIWRLLGWPSVPYLSSFRELWTLPELPDGTVPSARSAILTAILWHIWKGRNELVSNGVHVPPRTTFTAIATDLELWKHRTKDESARTSLVLWSLHFRNIVI